MVTAMDSFMDMARRKLVGGCLGKLFRILVCNLFAAYHHLSVYIPSKIIISCFSFIWIASLHKDHPDEF